MTGCQPGPGPAGRELLRKSDRRFKIGTRDRGSPQGRRCRVPRTARCGGARPAPGSRQSPGPARPLGDSDSATLAEAVPPYRRGLSCGPSAVMSSYQFTNSDLRSLLLSSIHFQWGWP
eukprot:751654-Hanusia_phi.AAC.5